nr:heterokaryon incompatibility protein [Colletotrichum truncatum]KAF6793133.1 heterokaryon incompatibility protein [Colletotrichum truncatum]
MESRPVARYARPRAVDLDNTLSSEEVRLVLVEPSEPGSDIECSLRTFGLDNIPAYTAISYAWGDRRDNVRILIDGRPRMVTTSLRDALIALRDSVHAIWVWADAISINQSDIQELSRQVQIMDKIYATAERVAVWLGPASASEKSGLAFESLLGVVENSKEEPFPALIGDLINSKPAVEAIVSLFERSYWKRLWVMQEVFYAQRIEIYCGTDKIGWDALMKTVDQFSTPHWKRRVDELYPPGGAASRFSKSHYSFAQILTTQGPKGLFDPRRRRFQTASVGNKESGLSGEALEPSLPKPLTVMRICRSKLAAQPQDKVLGALSLLPSNSFLREFQHTPKEAYTDIVATIILKTESLDIICEAIHYPFHQDTFDLPSWVPDWSHAPDTVSLAATQLAHRTAFQASKGTKWEYSPNLAPWPLRNELPITGITLGTIFERGMAVGTMGRLTNYLMAFLEWRHMLMDEHDGWDKSLRETFCKTLCLGDVPSTLDLGSGERQLDDGEWIDISFHLFAAFLQQRLSRLPLDEELYMYRDKEFDFEKNKARRIFQEYFGDRMMGRCFCLLQEGEGQTKMGMGTGYMGVGDLVVIAHGCSTPIILRPTGLEGKFQFIGDVYVDGYMDGEAIEDAAFGPVQNFVLC